MIAGDELGIDYFLSAIHHNRGVAFHLRRRPGDGFQVVAKVLEQRIGDGIWFAFWRDSGDMHEPRGFLYWKGPQHNRIDQAEDGGVRADAERERQHRHREEAGTPAERPRGAAEIFPEVFEPAAAHVAAILLDLFASAEFQALTTPRLVRFDARSDGIPHQAFEVVP